MGKISLGFIVFSIMLCFAESELAEPFAAIGVVLGLISMFRYLVVQERVSVEKVQQERNERLSTFYKFKSEYNLPSKVKPMRVINSSKNIFHGKYYAWVEDNNLKLISYTPQKEPLTLTINIDDILFFNRYGDSYMETNVSGGGSNIPGALIGGVVAGGVGAIIGSREEVVTVNEYKDNRKTILYFKDLDSSEKNIIFSSCDYNTLMQLIPLKDYSLVMFKTTNKNA